jgi:trehalose-phosphatase
MAVPLLEHLADLREQIVRAAQLLVLLDYDGTLTPLVDRPGDAHLAPATRATIVALTQRSNTTVAILSGRALEDVQRRVGIAGLIYAGNHGLEITGPDVDFVGIAPGPVQDQLHQLAEELAERFRPISGVLVENKRLTLSVHFRLVADDKQDEFHHAVRHVFGDLPSCFRMTTGHKVYEIRPQIDWNKGAAALWLCNRLGGREVLPVYLGDDRTDEDAFLALVGGITIKVGNPAETSAAYYLAGPPEVRRFLQWLAEECQQACGENGADR